MEESDFIKGSWYKGIGEDSAKDWYICFNNFIDDKINASEYIESTKRYTKVLELSNFGKINELEWELIDISEVQPYLPEDHPDKYKNVYVESDLDWFKSLKKLINV